MSLQLCSSWHFLENRKIIKKMNSFKPKTGQKRIAQAGQGHFCIMFYFFIFFALVLLVMMLFVLRPIIISIVPFDFFWLLFIDWRMFVCFCFSFHLVWNKCTFILFEYWYTKVRKKNSLFLSIKTNNSFTVWEITT